MTRPSRYLLLIVALAFPGLLAPGLARALDPAESPDPSAQRRAWIGVLLDEPLDGGATVAAVLPGSPAQRGGILAGDVLLSLNDHPIGDRESLETAFESFVPGDRIRLEVLRGGRRAALEIVAEPWMFRAWPTPRAVAPPSPPEPGGWQVYPPLGEESGEVLGLTLARIPAELRSFYGAPAGAGVLVTRVEPGSPAAAAGCEVGDVVVRAGQVDLEAPADLERVLLVAGRETALEIRAVRDGEALDLALALPAAPTPTPYAAGFERARAVRARALEREIERLQRRLAELEQELERLRAE
jgi:predicted metalloprotease with PDZ domain